MKTKLQEALKLCEEMCADVNGEYPVGLLRVRRLLEEVRDECFLDEDDVAVLVDDPPMPAA
jgi:hypothetical protein